MTENRVLSLAEVLALEEGARVWVEDRDWKSLSGAHRAARNYTDDDNAGKWVGSCLVDGRGKYWPLYSDFEALVTNHEVRVWSLPQPPTPDELAANPWPSVTE